MVKPKLKRPQDAMQLAHSVFQDVIAVAGGFPEAGCFGSISLDGTARRHL
jgi:hypothetical protein